MLFFEKNHIFVPVFLFKMRKENCLSRISEIFLLCCSFIFYYETIRILCNQFYLFWRKTEIDYTCKNMHEAIQRRIYLRANM